MALSLARAAPLKPEIKLAKALSEFEVALPTDQKTKLRTYRGQSPPNPTDVIKFTAEIDRDFSRNRKSRQCVGTRLTNVLHAVQQFSTVVDAIVGSSQSQIAGAIWGTVKLSLQLASTISSYFDQLSTLFMKIGRTCPTYQDFGLLYPESARLQSALCEYFVVIVHLCKQAVLFLKKPFWSQVSFSVLKPFETEFGSFQKDLESLAGAIRDEVSLASNKAQQNGVQEISRFRAFAKNFSDTSTREIGEAKTRKRKEARSQFLNACSAYNYEKSWKQARKQGNTNWIFHDEDYKQWKQAEVSCTLWCSGILGSGKTVLSANVVEDLKTTSPAAVAVACFFCRHDEAESLETRTIIGSIARQIFDHINSDVVDAVADIGPDKIDTDQILDYLQNLLPSNSYQCFIVIDGLDECEDKESKLLIQCLKKLLASQHVFRIYCSSRPIVFYWAYALLKPRWFVSMAQTSVDIEEYIKDSLKEHLKLGSLSIGSPAMILTIQRTLLERAQGMFLWVTFQIDSICSQKTDDAILTALEDLPKDLPDTFNRILRKLQHSNADSQFCKKVFDLVAAAQRPLTLEELREAVSVTPGETSWDASKLVNDMLRSLSDSCGSLVAVDEEHLTVHFAHHSVKQYLLSEPTDSGMIKYHIIMEEADLYLGNIIVTYLNYGIFDRQLGKTKSKNKTLLPVENFSSTFSRSLPPSNIARIAVRLLKNKGNSRLDIHSQLKLAAGIVDESKDEAEPAHPFLPYAQEYWLFHTKESRPADISGSHLWQSLIGGIDINAMGENQRTALQAALESGHEGIAKLLLKNGANANAEGGRYGTALQVASYYKNEEMTRLLLESGADVNARGGEFGTALQAASVYGREEIARLLLENGADVNAIGGICGTALQAASSSGYEQTVRLLLENGADVNAIGGICGTALQAASSSGYEQTVRLLLENGADVNAIGGNYGTALRAASSSGRPEIVRLLVKNGADVNAMGGEHGTALQGASLYGYKEIARLLLENGADVNAKGGKYGTALQAASSRGHGDIVRLLLKNGADVNATVGEHGTALQTASLYGYKEIARLLLENGADVNAKGGKYGTALQAASSRGHGDIVGLLLKNGADVNATVGEHGTALQTASFYGYEKIVRLLLKNGADINAKGGKHGTALQTASLSGYDEITRLLQENGADVSAIGVAF